MVDKRIHLLAYPLVSLVESDAERGTVAGEKRRPPKDVRRDEK